MSYIIYHFMSSEYIISTNPTDDIHVSYILLRIINILTDSRNCVVDILVYLKATIISGCLI